MPANHLPQVITCILALLGISILALRTLRGQWDTVVLSQGSRDEGEKHVALWKMVKSNGEAEKLQGERKGELPRQRRS